MEEKQPEKKEIQLTSEELRFCELYVYGGSEFAGKREKCYAEVFCGDEEDKNVSIQSHRLLSQACILSQVKELSDKLSSELEHIAIKMQVGETLKAVMEETATSTFYDKFGISLSPAPLRAVSVNAAKALMELYPIKHAQETKLKIEGANGNVVFNVIVPENSPKENN